MDEENSIFLRQSQHLPNLVSQLADQSFAQKFGDLKMVFPDITVNFYKLLLATTNRVWRDALINDDIDVVIIENISAAEFFRTFQFFEHIETQGSDHSPLVENEGETFVTLAVDDVNENHDGIKTEIVEELDEIEDEDNFIYSNMTIDMNACLSWTPGSKDSERALSLISSDFSWPSYLNAPNFHSMNWRTSSEAFEILGNRSIFSLLEENFTGLPSETTFSVRYMEDPSENVSGFFRLKEFVNGGAFHDLGVFLVEGQEQTVSLRSLLQRCKYKTERGDIIQNSENINIVIGETLKSLKELTDGWKKHLISDSRGKELLRGSKFSKDVFMWLRNQAICTPEGNPICMYCGFVCYDQSPRGDFTGHMRRHLYRKRKCKRCNGDFLAGEEHLCDVYQLGNRRERAFPCSEVGCNKIYKSKERLVGHLKSVHRIVEKIVTMRQCAFCTELVPDLRIHYIEAHKNESVTCKFCEKTFTNPNKYKLHLNNVHERKYSGFCEICQKECNSLIKHNIQVHSSKSYPCEHCEKVFKHEKSLEDHMKSVNGTWDKKQCPECSNFYVNVSDHIRRYHRGYKNPSKFCGNCRKKIPKESFKEHTMVCIQEETICHICSDSVKNINSHLAKKHRLARIKCGLCETQVTVTGELNTHLKTAHFPAILDELGFAPSSQSTEDREQRELIALKIIDLYAPQTADTKYRCKFCGSESVTKTQMLTHIKYHLGYNFKRGKEGSSNEGVCPSCGKLFKVRYRLKAHLAKGNCMEVKFVGTKSTEQKKFDHEEVESKVNIVKERLEPEIKRPVKEIVRLECDKCDRVFQRIANLRKHKATSHNPET